MARRSAAVTSWKNGFTTRLLSCQPQSPTTSTPAASAHRAGRFQLAPVRDSLSSRPAASSPMAQETGRYRPMSTAWLLISPVPGSPSQPGLAARKSPSTHSSSRKAARWRHSMPSASPASAGHSR